MMEGLSDQWKPTLETTAHLHRLPIHRHHHAAPPPTPTPGAQHRQAPRPAGAALPARLGVEHPQLVLGRGQVVLPGVPQRDDARPHDVPGPEALVDLDAVDLCGCEFVGGWLDFGGWGLRDW